MPKNFWPKVNDVHAKTTNIQWIDILSGGGFCPFTFIHLHFHEIIMKQSLHICLKMKCLEGNTTPMNISTHCLLLRAFSLV